MIGDSNLRDAMVYIEQDEQLQDYGLAIVFSTKSFDPNRTGINYSC